MRKRRASLLKLTQRELKELIFQKNHLCRVEESTCVFGLLDEQAGAISDLELFASMLDHRIEAYETLRVKVNKLRKKLKIRKKIAGKGQESAETGETEHGYVSHENIVRLFELKVTSAFKFARQYLESTVGPKRPKRGDEQEFRSKAAELKAFLESDNNKDSPSARIYSLASVYERLTEINCVTKGRHYGRDSSLGTALGGLDRSLELTKLTKTPNMVDKCISTTTIQPIKIEKPLKITVELSEQITNPAPGTNSQARYLAYGKNNSFLATFERRKIVLKQNRKVESNKVLALKFENNMKKTCPEICIG